MRPIDADALSAFVGDLRSTFHKEQSTFKAMTQSEFEIKDNMYLNFQYAIDNAPTVEYPFYQEAYQSGYEEGKNERPKGEWIIVRDEKWGDNVKCPFCGKELAGTDLNFCCKCGAKLIGSEKMNGGQKNETDN
jgi:hypothetical protein